jgi:hypothetical protein
MVTGVITASLAGFSTAISVLTGKGIDNKSALSFSPQEILPLFPFPCR